MFKLRFKNAVAFNKSLDAFGKSIPEKQMLLQKKIAIDLFSRIIEKTPVGNPDLWVSKTRPPGYVGGRARANWQIQLSIPGTNANMPPDIGATTGAPVGGTQLAQGLGSMSALKSGQTIWIYNNVRYIKRLEEGHSVRQAPAGMVAVSIAEIQAGL